MSAPAPATGGAAVERTPIPTHRSVSFSHKLSHPFDGTAFANGVCLGDVDNDGGHELVVAATEGQLSIYKGTNPVPWRGPENQGTFTCVTVGDIKNTGSNAVVCATAEGVCSILELVPSTREYGLSQPTPTFTQRIPVNPKVLLLADVDGDGCNELVIGKTDRVVLTYRWSKDESYLMPHWTVEFPGQIGSLASILTADGILLGVSQPGGTLMLIDRVGNTSHTSGLSNSNARGIKGLETQVLGCINAGRPPKRSAPSGSDGSASIISGRGSNSPTPNPQLTAICTTAGLLKVGSLDGPLWQLQFDRRLFALSKLDVTGDGFDNLVTCAWDGHTVVVDHDRNTLRYDFGREVCAFAAGQYAVDPGVNQPTLVYVTLQEPETKECVITIFYDLGVSTVRAESLASSQTAAMLDFREERLSKWGS